MASVMIFAAGLFDFFDGFTARLLNAHSPIGGDLDSLSDVVSFGVAPGFIMYRLMSEGMAEPIWPVGGVSLFACFAFLLPVFSAVRLAKFNIDERQTLSFIGLPTPANAIFWIGLTYLNEIPAVHQALGGTVYFLIMLICSFLLICELPMFSLKLKPGHNSFGENKARYILIASSVIILLVSWFLGFSYFAASPALIILLYLLLSIIF